MMPPAPYAHVIMPIGSDPAWRQKQDAIAAAVRASGLEPHFPRYLPLRPAFDLASLRADIEHAAVVVADLSLERPSCYYELALAEAAGTPVIAVAERGTPIHQTAARGRVGFYTDTHDLEVVISECLRARLLHADRPVPAV